MLFQWDDALHHNWGDSMHQDLVADMFDSDFCVGDAGADCKWGLPKVWSFYRQHLLRSQNTGTKFCDQR